MTHVSLATTVVLLFVIGACASTPPLPTASPTPAASATPSPTVSPRPTVTPSPTPTPVPLPTLLTTITTPTDFGTVTLQIPAPLIPAGVAVTVELRPAEDAPRDLRDAGVRQPFHVLLPQDLTFSQPIGVALAVPTAQLTRADGSIAIAYLAVQGADGTWDWLADADIHITADTTVISGTTTHLGALFAWSDRTDLIVIPPELGTHAVGEAFRPLINIASREPRDHPVAFVGAPEFVNPAPTVIEIGPPLTTETSREWRCLAAGNVAVAFTAGLMNFGTDNPFFGVTLDLPPNTGTLTYDMTGSCVNAAPVTPNPTPNSSPSSSP